VAAAAIAVVLVAAAVYLVSGSGGRAGKAATTSTLPRSHSAGSQPTTVPTTAPAALTPVWQVAWGSTMAWAFPGQHVSNSTVRTLVSVPVDAQAVRLRISNQFGNAPMEVEAATVGHSAGGAAVYPGTLAALTFGGQAAVTIPAGQAAYSDPLSLTVSAPETLAVSVYVADTDSITAHYPCCEAATPSYVSLPGTGDLAGRPQAAGFSFGAPYSRLVDALLVERTDPPGGRAPRGSIVVVGDSITDGFNSTARWTDYLQQRIDDVLPPTERPAVVNEGNTANALTAVVPSDATTGGAPAGIQRLADDALDFPGVSTVVLFLGTNDLFFGASPQAVIAGYQQAAARVHAAGRRVVGVTLLPRQGSEKWNPVRQHYLAQINEWLLGNNGVFDGVINLATATANMYNGACVPDALFPPYNSGDFLHPNAAGDVAMADAINPAVLGLPSLPQIPRLVKVTPTAGCRGAPGIPAPRQ
jgi:lysophospholipase L1-like esterase